MKKKTKKETKIAIQSAIDHAYNVSKDRIAGMTVHGGLGDAMMIEKNRGYMMALEDVTDLLYANGVF